MPEPVALRRDLSAIIGDGMAFSVMVGVGERTFQQFALALGHGEVASGLAATLPVAIAAVAQLASPILVERAGSERRWVITASTIQAFSFLPLILAAWQGTMPLAALFACMAIYHFGGLGPAPAWTSWMEVLVPPRLREHFFARRSAYCHGATLVAIVGAGAYLAAAGNVGRLLPAFGVIFAVAAAARLVSVGFLMTQGDSGPLVDGHRRIGAFEVIGRLWRPSALRALFAWLPFLAAVHIAQAFFVPWARERRGLDDDLVLWLTAAEFLGRLAALPLLGALARHRGAKTVLRLGCIALTPIAALWAVAPEYGWLIAVQIVAGAAWAAVELGSFLLFFETTHRSERASVMSVFYLANFTAPLAGSLIGGAILAAAGRDDRAFFFVFAVSTVARLATLRLLRKRPPHAPAGSVAAPS